MKNNPTRWNNRVLQNMGADMTIEETNGDALNRLLDYDSLINLRGTTIEGEIIPA